MGPHLGWACKSDYDFEAKRGWQGRRAPLWALEEPLTFRWKEGGWREMRQQMRLRPRAASEQRVAKSGGFTKTIPLSNMWRPSFQMVLMTCVIFPSHLCLLVRDHMKQNRDHSCMYYTFPVCRYWAQCGTRLRTCHAHPGSWILQHCCSC